MNRVRITAARNLPGTNPQDMSRSTLLRDIPYSWNK